MKLRVALDIIGKEVNKLQGATPAFYISLGYILAYLENHVGGGEEISSPPRVSDKTEVISLGEFTIEDGK